MLGYQWYLDGKLEKRENTFNDFVDVGIAPIKLDILKKYLYFWKKCWGELWVQQLFNHLSSGDQ